MAKKVKISEKNDGVKPSSKYGYQGNQRSRYGYDSSMDDGSHTDVLEDPRESALSELGFDSDSQEKLLKLLKQMARRINETSAAPAKKPKPKKEEEEGKENENENADASVSNEAKKPTDPAPQNKSVDTQKEEEKEGIVKEGPEAAAPSSSSETKGKSAGKDGKLKTVGAHPTEEKTTSTDKAQAETPQAEQASTSESKAPARSSSSAAREIDMKDASKDGGVARMDQSNDQAKTNEQNHLETVSGNKVHQGGKNIKQLGTNEKKKEDAGTKLDKTKGAVEEKKTDKVAEANTQQVKTVDEEKKPEVKKDEAENTFDAALQSSLPQTVEDVDDFKEDRVASKIGDQVKKTIEDKTKDVSGTFETLDKTPAPAEPKKATPFEPIEQADPTAEMNVGKGLVPKVDEKSINLDSYVEESDNLLSREGIKQEHLDLATSGDLAEAKKIQSDIETKAADAPQQIRKDEKEIHGSNEAELKAKEDHVKAKMKKERDTHLGGARGKQTGTKEDLEKKKEEVTNHINKIYEDTNKKVQEKLDNLKKNSLDTFAKEEAAASSTFEANVKERMDKFKDKRYSGVSGKLKKGYDWVMGLDDLPEVKTIFEEEKATYVNKIDASISKIIADSQRVVEECKSLISQARTEIDEYVKGLSPALKKIGEEAEKEIKKKLDELDEKVNKAAAELKELMEKKRADAIANIDKKIEEMKEEMSGFLSKMGDLLLDAALKFFKWALEAAGHSADEIMAIINKGKAVLTAVVSDPIQFLKNLANAVGGGIKSFGANIMKHLGEGFMTWLTGQLNSLPIELPEKFDLKGVFSLVMQVLGLSYGNIRAKLSDQVGEDKVALAEKSVEVVMEVKEKGPIALYDMMAEKADSIKTEFIEGAKEWAIGTMIKQGLIRLAMMINPAGAIVQAVLAIYNGVIFFVNNWDKIVDFVNSIFDSIASIASGAISTASAFIEKTMAKTIPLILDFIAQQLNLSGIAEKITKIIHRIRKPIDEVIDKVIAFITNKVKKIAGKVLGKDKDKKKDGKHAPEDHKEDKEQTKKDFDKDKGDDKTTDVDRDEHKRIGEEIKHLVKSAPEKKDDSFEEFYKRNVEFANILEKKYQPQLKPGINIKITLNNFDENKKDSDVTFKIHIGPNNYDGLVSVHYKDEDVECDIIDLFDLTNSKSNTEELKKFKKYYEKIKGFEAEISSDDADGEKIIAKIRGKDGSWTETQGFIYLPFIEEQQNAIKALKDESKNSVAIMGIERGGGILVEEIADKDISKRFIQQVKELRFNEEKQKFEEVRLKSLESQALINEIISIASKSTNEKITISIAETVVGGGSTNNIIKAIKENKILESYPNLTIKLLLLQQTMHSDDNGEKAEKDIKVNLDGANKDLEKGKIKVLNNKSGRLQLIFSQTSYIIGEDVGYQLSKNIPTSKKPVIIFNGNQNNLRMKSFIPKGESTARDIIVALIKGKFDNVLAAMKS